MTPIRIHLDGKPVTKLQAAQAVSVVGARGVRIGFPAEDGDLLDYIDLYGRSRAYGEIQPPLGRSSSFGADASRMRQRAEMLILAAEIAELAEMLAAEQDQAPEPAEHDETVSPDRAETIRRAVELIDTTPRADLLRYLVQTRVHPVIQVSPAALRVGLASAVPGTPEYYSGWQAAQQLLHAAGLPR